MTTENSQPVASVHPIVLLPCPFCGGKAEICFQRDDLDDWKVECQGCGAVSCPQGIRYDKQKAIEDWNTRIDYEDAESWRSMAKGFAESHKASLGKDCGVWDSRNVSQ